MSEVLERSDWATSPGPLERVWAYLTESDLRKQWLASGPMELTVGGRVELVWRNNELTGAYETPPPRFEKEEHRLESRITRLDPPRLLAFSWGEGEVTFELAPDGDAVILTVDHRRISSRQAMVDVSACWHAHLALLVARVEDRTPPGFWATWQGLEQEYDRRLPPE